MINHCWFWHFVGCVQVQNTQNLKDAAVSASSASKLGQMFSSLRCLAHNSRCLWPCGSSRARSDTRNVAKKSLYLSFSAKNIFTSSAGVEMQMEWVSSKVEAFLHMIIPHCVSWMFLLWELHQSGREIWPEWIVALVNARFIRLTSWSDLRL